MKRLKKISWVVAIILVAVLAINYQLIFDFFKGLAYSPSSEMVEIRDKLDLSTRGEIIFNASMPELNTEDTFNSNCKAYNEVETILGCYTEGRIFVYDINEDELSGIVEVTTAHELLHAVYKRMSGLEKEGLKESLAKVYDENLNVLEEELKTYSSEDQQEEIYVRAGTEIRDLPENLENHFSNYFKDRNKIVDYYEKYVGVFRKYESEIREIEAKLNDLDVLINERNVKYREEVDNLNKKIDEFNKCANTAGCFNSDAEFYNKREELISVKNWVESLYDEIDGLIKDYNFNVEKLNENIIRVEQFQDIINSHVKVEDIQ